MSVTDSVFVNVSNHPSALWGDDQMRAALALGDVVVDVDFPGVPSLATKADVRLMAKRVVAKVMAVAGGRRVVAHVMGELTLSFAIVGMLRAEGVVCVASSTERVVEILPDGRKASSFRFGLFREY